MNSKYLILLVLIVLLLDAVSALKTKKFAWKKRKQIEEKIENLQEQEDELEKELENEIESLDEETQANSHEFLDFAPNYEEDEQVEDPCIDMHCGAGRECIIDEEGKGSCQCVEFCMEVEDPRRKVCTNHNETWTSDCALYRMRCYCFDNSTHCTDPKYQHVHIDYYGVCQAVPKCTPEEKEDFPRRMREWLFNIMRDMVDRGKLSEHYKKLEEIAEEDDTKKWINAAVWKWCELDGHPRDKSVSRHELFPLRAPLYTLEHCIAPFLDSCDPDGDHSVTLNEWTQCLELSDQQMEHLEDLCEDIQE